MKQIITYPREDIERLAAVLNGLTITGMQNAKQLAVAAQIIDSGIPGEIKEPDGEKNKEKDGD